VCDVATHSWTNFYRTELCCTLLQEHHLPPNREPILWILNLQLQRQRCSRLERFFKAE
jgi:hypothetical protein